MPLTNHAARFQAPINASGKKKSGAILLRISRFFNRRAAATALPLLLCAGLAAGPAHTLTISFDDLPGCEVGTGPAVPNGYQGFNWSSFYCLHPALSYAGTGYDNGTVSAPSVAYSGFGGSAEFEMPDGTFTLNSVFLTAAWNNGLNVRIQAFAAGDPIYDETH